MPVSYWRKYDYNILSTDGDRRVITNISKWFLTFFDKKLDFRVRLFNILAMAGTLISISMALLSILTASWTNVIVNSVCAILSAGLLFFLYVTGRYKLCYMITIIAIFLGLFPVLFFSGGGYHSGMPCFFVFAVIFTMLMLDGLLAILLSVIQIIVYICCCLVCYFKPELVKFFPTETDIAIDVIIAFVCVCAACGTVLWLHLREYNKQQSKLMEQNRRLKEFDEIKSTFLTTVAHEIKNPLAAITLHAQDSCELMCEEEIDAELIRDNQQTIENLVTIIDRIVLDLMDTVAIEQGRLALSIAPMRLSSVIQEAGSIMLSKIKSNKNTLIFELDEALPPVHADHARIMQVLTNLLSNAAHHTHSGKIIVQLTAEGDFQKISVTDTGEGMDEVLLERVFSGYVSANKDHWRHGIGLFVSHQIVLAHSGEIRIESKKGEGTRVSFTLPMEEKQDG